MSDATPRPWCKESKYIAADYGNGRIRPIGCMFTDDDGELVVRAVNTYDEREALILELVSCLRLIRGYIACQPQCPTHKSELISCTCGMGACDDRVTAALTKARQVLDGE